MSYLAKIVSFADSQHDIARVNQNEFWPDPKKCPQVPLFCSNTCRRGRRVVVAVYLPEPNPDKRQLEKRQVPRRSIGKSCPSVRQIY